MILYFYIPILVKLVTNYINQIAVHVTVAMTIVVNLMKVYVVARVIQYLIVIQLPQQQQQEQQTPARQQKQQIKISQHTVRMKRMIRY